MTATSGPRATAPAGGVTGVCDLYVVFESAGVVPARPRLRAVRGVTGRSGRTHDSASTVTDVARHAGVAPSTVSYVLSGKRSISAETRQRVLASIRALGYHPHAGARALASNRANVIALVLPLRAGHARARAHAVRQRGGHHGAAVRPRRAAGHGRRRVLGAAPDRGQRDGRRHRADGHRAERRAGPAAAGAGSPERADRLPRLRGRADLRGPRLLRGRRGVPEPSGRSWPRRRRAPRRAAGGVRARHGLRHPDHGRLPPGGRAARASAPRPARARTTRNPYVGSSPTCSRGSRRSPVWWCTTRRRSTS